MDKSFCYPEGYSRIGFFGIGKSNLSLISALPPTVCVTLRSDKKIDRAKIPPHIKPTHIYEGDAALCDIHEDILILSPSVRRDRAELLLAQERGVVLCSDCELFFDAARAPVFAVSGSAGKSTSVTLAHLALLAESGGYRLVGNIGTPMLQSVSDGVKGYIAELSSFMLQSFTPRLKRYALTNIVPNHLDFHKSFKEYRDTKLAPLRLCDEGIICADDATLSSIRYEKLYAVYSISESICNLATKYNAEVYFTLEDGYICRNGEKILGTEKLLRKDARTVQNMMCAAALTDGYADKGTLVSAFSNFGGLSHRCETVHSRGGVDFINSSIDTSPDRCSATLSSLGRRVVLLLGGRGKGLSYNDMIPPVLKYARVTVLFGEEKEKLYSLLSDKISCIKCDSFDEAVKAAASAALPTEAVLLSPACTSYDAFSSFEERGDRFRDIVRSL